MIIQAKVLQPFPYSLDGIRARDLEVGAIEQFHSDHTDGLRQAGYIELPVLGFVSGSPKGPPENAAHTGAPENKGGAAGSGSGGSDLPVVEPIPGDWQEMTWQEMRSLASKVSPTPVSNKAEAAAAIEAEIARRAQL